MSDLFNVEAEQAVLGALLLNNDILPRLGLLSAEHFYDPVHGQIFALARERIAEGSTASPVTLKFALQDDEGLKALGGPAYLVRLAGAAPAVSAIGEMAGLIREFWARRTLRADLSEAAERLASADGGGFREIVSEVEGRLADRLNTSGTLPMSRSFRASLVDALSQASEAYAESAPPGVPSGLAALDEVVRLRPGRLIVLAGRPSMGKTAVALSIATRVAMAGYTVPFVSLEMYDTELSMRAVSMLLRDGGRRLPYHQIENGKLSEEEFLAVIELARAHEALPIRYLNREHRDLARLRTVVRATVKAARAPVGLVVVDYLQLIEVAGSRSAFDRVSAASKAMQSLAMDLGVPILLLSQLNRGLEDRDDKRPRLGDLRASGEIEEDASSVILLYRPEYYLERTPTEGMKSELIGKHHADLDASRDKLELIVAKNKGGPIRTVSVRCEVKHNFVADWGVPAADPGQGDFF